MQMFRHINLIKILILAALFINVAHALPLRPIEQTKIIGQDENFTADVVELGDGSKALKTSGLIQIDELNGNPADGLSYFAIGSFQDNNGQGNAGDTFRVQIAAAGPPLDILYPAIDVTTTVTAGHLADPYPERAVALQICADLDADPDFVAAWKCSVLKDHSTVFINSKLYNEAGWRVQGVSCVTITDCFKVTTTGAAVATVAFSEIRSHPLTTELQRSPNDLRRGTLNVAGSFQQTPGGTGNLLFKQLMDGGTASLIADGSVTPISYRINCDSVFDEYINFLRIFLTCSGLKLTKWACSNSALPNGLKVTVRSEGEDLVLLDLKTTSDLINKFAIGDAGPTGQARIDIQQGGDSLTASLAFPGAAIIKKCGTNGTATDDYIEILIRDDLTGASGGNLTEMQSLVFGFKREP